MWSCHCLCRLAAKFPYAIAIDVGNSIRPLLEAKGNPLKDDAIEDEVVNNLERRSTGYNVSWNILQRAPANSSLKLHPTKQTQRLHPETGIPGKGTIA